MNEGHSQAMKDERGRMNAEGGSSNLGSDIHRSAFSIHRSSIRRLLVRGPNWIGDAVMSEPALAVLRGLFPEAEVTLLVKPAIASLFQGHPDIDRILVYEDRGRHAGLGGKWALAGELRRRQFDVAILFQNAFEAALLTFLAGIPRRHGYATDGRSLLLSDPIALPERETIGHHVEYYLNLLKPLGGSGSQVAQPRLFLSNQEERDMGRKLAEAGLSESEVIVGVNPGSTYGGAKRWLPERFAETADRLARDRGGPVVIVGARGEEALGHAIAHKMAVKPLVLSGQTSIRELMAVIKRCKLFLTNDTGPMHIAAAFGVPVVALFGPTDHRNTSPWGHRHTIVRHPVDCSPCLLRECPIDHRCMTRIMVDEVVRAAKRLLETMNDERGTLNEQQTDYDAQRSSFSVHHSALRGVTVFLDRDGTLNRDSGYVKTVEELELFPDTVEAVARLNRAGARLVVITNQSGIARGLFTAATLEAIHGRLRTLLQAGGASLDGIYYCPHHPDDGCACRKPQRALVDRAVADLGLDLSLAYVVGDQKRDVELAMMIGAHSVLVTTGPASLQALASLEENGLPPDYTAAGLAEAVDWILADSASRQQSAFTRQVRLAER
ncbi:MAG: lipopolysaccharide heptosyltransferase II [Nitrospirae bacterium]|nr:lipopolysaccharide heptosyltransferase II [Nitrospirota bacterium]